MFTQRHQMTTVGHIKTTFISEIQIVYVQMIVTNDAVHKHLGNEFQFLHLIDITL